LQTVYLLEINSFIAII